MARKALIIKCKRKKEAHFRALKDGRKINFSTRTYNRCSICGRPRGYIRRFGLCRICVRRLAAEGEIMGLKKSSW